MSLQLLRSFLHLSKLNNNQASSYLEEHQHILNKLANNYNSTIYDLAIRVCTGTYVQHAINKELDAA